MFCRRLVLLGLLVGLGGGLVSGADKPATSRALLRLARHQERTLRDLNAAIATYKQVIGVSDAGRELQAGAHLGIGGCLNRQGKLSEARQAYQTVVREFKEYPDSVRSARSALHALDTANPAALLPEDTLLYVELSDAGAQFDRIIDILDRANISRKLVRFLSEGQSFLPLREILTEAAMAELKKIEAFGIGLVQFSRGGVNIDEYSHFVAALFPGESQGVRALLGGLAQGLKSAGEHAGASLYILPETYGKMHLALRHDVILVGAPLETVTEALDRYDGKVSNSLAKQREFRVQAAARRQDSALITYANVSKISPIFKSIEFQDDDFRQADAILGLETVERILGRVGLTEDRLTVEVSFMLVPGKRSPFLSFFRSGPMDRSVLAHIPQDAVGAVSLALVDPIDKWQQFQRFANVIYSVGNPEGGGEPPEEAISNLELLLELRIGDDLLASVESASLVLTGLERPADRGRSRLRNNLVLMIRSSDSAGLMVKLDHLADVAARLVPGDEKPPVQRSEVSLGTVVGRVYDIPGVGTSLTLARTENMLFLASRPEPIRQCLEARSSRKSLAELGRAHPLGDLPEGINKFGFLRIDRFLEAIARREQVEGIPSAPLEPIVLSTIEQAHEVSFRVEVNDLAEVISRWVGLYLLRDYADRPKGRQGGQRDGVATGKPAAD